MHLSITPCILISGPDQFRAQPRPRDLQAGVRFCAYSCDLQPLTLYMLRKHLVTEEPQEESPTVSAKAHPASLSSRLAHGSCFGPRDIPSISRCPSECHYSNCFCTSAPASVSAGPDPTSSSLNLHGQLVLRLSLPASVPPRAPVIMVDLLVVESHGPWFSGDASYLNRLVNAKPVLTSLWQCKNSANFSFGQWNSLSDILRGRLRYETSQS